MKKNLTKITLRCTVFILFIAFILSFLGSGEKLEDIKAEQMVDLNEIEQLSLQGDLEATVQKIHELQNKIEEMESNDYIFPDKFNKKDYIITITIAFVCLAGIILGAFIK